ncbi:hypothetical protein [Streptomyces clavifer]|uniref:hypothetical protein n=1 Tax=Streptomyces clavifer TaxID=68188 RepID=UPI00380AD96D
MEDRAAQAPAEVKKQVEEVLTRMLGLLDDAHVTPENRAAYMHIVGGITSTLKVLDDPDLPPEDRAAYIRIVKAMTAAVTAALDSPPRSHAPQGPQWAMRTLGNTSAGLMALNGSQSAPEDPKDRKKIQENIEEACKAARTAQDPKASPEEREEARSKVKQRMEALKNAQYLTLLKEIKHYKPSAACVETVENRTRQVGWSDGALWGLSGTPCAATVAAGASQEDTELHALLVCVQHKAFSSCVEYIPED